MHATFKPPYVRVFSHFACHLQASVCATTECASLTPCQVIWDNDQLESLRGIGNFTQLFSRLWIDTNLNLTDLSGLGVSADCCTCSSKAGTTGRRMRAQTRHTLLTHVCMCTQRTRHVYTQHPPRPSGSDGGVLRRDAQGQYGSQVLGWPWVFESEALLLWLGAWRFTCLASVYERRCEHASALAECMRGLIKAWQSSAGLN